MVSYLGWGTTLSLCRWMFTWIRLLGFLLHPFSPGALSVLIPAIPLLIVRRTSTNTEFSENSSVVLCCGCLHWQLDSQGRPR